MLEWLSENLGSIVVAAVLIAVVSCIVYKMIKDKREGKSTCSHGCQNCAMHGQCHYTGK